MSIACCCCWTSSQDLKSWRKFWSKQVSVLFFLFVITFLVHLMSLRTNGKSVKRWEIFAERPAVSNSLLLRCKANSNGHTIQQSLCNSFFFSALPELASKWSSRGWERCDEEATVVSRNNELLNYFNTVVKLVFKWGSKIIQSEMEMPSFSWVWKQIRPLSGARWVFIFIVPCQNFA